ncbi:kielin/chordin-like protein [Anabrus simplex]|uniref:kielin/chordin-like protein n=1 Tax=Anabrus simplex TaxID=316456 RepID=UPI0035A34672
MRDPHLFQIRLDRRDPLVPGCLPSTCHSEDPAAPTTGLPPGIELQLEESPEGANQSNPEPCTVAGVQFMHGQQVPREDPCEFCLCLDGELFCWWQECPPTSAGPCGASRALSACANATAENAVSLSTTSTPAAVTVGPTETGETGRVSTMDATSPSANVASAAPANNTDSSPPSTTAATTCYVMGTEYKIGEVLPRDTGTCLECVCDSEARVTCSPKDCASHEDYRASNSLDMFDVDTF